MLVEAHLSVFVFFFNDTATTEIYTLSLHDALPISRPGGHVAQPALAPGRLPGVPTRFRGRLPVRSEEHTSELQSQSNLVCRLLLEKKKKHEPTHQPHTPTTTPHRLSPPRTRPRLQP